MVVIHKRGSNMTGVVEDRTEAIETVPWVKATSSKLIPRAMAMKPDMQVNVNRDQVMGVRDRAN